MGKLKYTSNGVVIQNELTISGSTASVNVLEKLSSLTPGGDTVIYNGEFNADSCSASGIYQYITLGRTGLDTTTDNHYSLLVIKTDDNAIRQIAFGTNLHSNVYSRVCVNNDWGNSGSTYTFQKIGNINTINLTSTNEITAKQSLVELAGDSVFYITNATNVFPGYGTVTVTTDNFKQLLELLSNNDAVKAFKSNWEAYYKVGTESLYKWYSQNISSYLVPPTFHVGDKIKLFKKNVTINDYFKKLIDWQSIDVRDKLTDAEKLIWAGVKALYGGTDITDGQCIVNMIAADAIYSANDGETEGHYQLIGSESITIYDYEVIPDPAYTNTYNVIASGTSEYVPFTLTEAKQIYISFSNGMTANWELQKDGTKIISGVELAAGEYYHCGVLAAGEYRIDWNSGNGTAMVSEYIRVTEASLKQDKLTADQLTNIDAVPSKQDSLSDKQIDNINNASILNEGQYYAGDCTAAGWYDEIRSGRPEGSESDEYYVLYTSENGSQLCFSKKNSGKMYHRASVSDLWTSISHDNHTVDELGSSSINTYIQSGSCDYNNWTNNGGDDPTAVDTTYKLLEFYSGDNDTLTKSKINLYQAVTLKPNSIIKVRCFYRQTVSPTDRQYDSNAYIYLSNSENPGHGIANIQSDYVKVKSLGSYPVTDYPASLWAVRNQFFLDTNEYGWQYIKTNNLTEGTYYLHIDGGFDVKQSWFCLGEVYVYTPQDTSSLLAKIDELETRIKALEDK